MKQSSRSNKGVIRFTVPETSRGERLDQCIAGCCEAISRTLARRLIDLGGVHLDGRRMRRCGQVVCSGQTVEIYQDGRDLEPFSLTEGRILYQDPYLLVLDKPAGVAVQPTPARYQGTVYAAVQTYLQGAGQKRPSIGMVQRLDQDTSGVLVFSTHPKAHKGLTEAFRDHRVQKGYVALVHGHMPEEAGTVCSQLARRRATNRMVSVERGGKHAETRYRVIRDYGLASLLDVEILTGRSHQIRVHCAEQGCPLLGDSLYEGPKQVAGQVLGRQMLHARVLAFEHPVTGKPLRFEAELPPDFKTMMAFLDRCTEQTGCPEHGDP